MTPENPVQEKEKEMSSQINESDAQAQAANKPPKASILKRGSSMRRSKKSRQRGHRMTSNVFNMFNQEQIQEFNEAFKFIDQVFFAARIFRNFRITTE